MSAGSLEKPTPSQTKTLLWCTSIADILWSRHTLLSQERMDCVTNKVRDEGMDCRDECMALRALRTSPLVATLWLTL